MSTSEPLPEKVPTKNEAGKLASRFLRGSLAEDLNLPETGLSPSNEGLIKFHGMYQQYDRSKPSAPKDRSYQFMIRGRIPGGRLSATQYLTWHRLAERYGGKNIRLTTRQTIQLYGLLKGDLRAILTALWDEGMTSRAACGDVVRNVMQAPNPFGRADLAQLDDVAQTVSDHFLPATRGYFDIWIDGAKVKPKEYGLVEDEPIYGRAYLPRKFKSAVTIAGDNSVDLYTNDLGLAATFGADGIIDGFFLFAGGGLGTTHGKPETYARAADLLGWFPKEKLLDACEAVVTIHRDYGDRTERKHARLKYVVAERGVAWMKGMVESRAGIRLEDRPLPKWEVPSALGWNKAEDGTWSLGFHVLSGRIKDVPGRPLFTAFKHLVSTWSLPVACTSEQDIVFLGIRGLHKPAIEAYLASQGLSPEAPHPLASRAMSCVSLPTCSLAIAEAERVFPKAVENVQALLVKHGLEERAPTFRMTGCGNGCGRAYAAEIGMVGQQPGKYLLVLGGDPAGTRVAFPVLEKLKYDDAWPLLDKLLAAWKADTASSKDSFGDWALAKGKTDLLAMTV